MVFIPPVLKHSRHTVNTKVSISVAQGKQKRHIDILSTQLRLCGKFLVNRNNDHCVTFSCVIIIKIIFMTISLENSLFTLEYPIPCIYLPLAKNHQMNVENCDVHQRRKNNKAQCSSQKMFHCISLKN